MIRRWESGATRTRDTARPSRSPGSTSSRSRPKNDVGATGRQGPPMKCDLLVRSAAQLITAPPGTGPLSGADLDRPILLTDAAVACVGGRGAALGGAGGSPRGHPRGE